MCCSFIRPSSGKEYKYIREKYATEESSPSQQSRWNTLNIILNKGIIKNIKYSNTIDNKNPKCHKNEL